MSPWSTTRRLHELEELGDDPRRQPEGGLVEEQHRRLGHQGPAEDEHLALAAGEHVGERGPPVGERREQVVDPLEVLGPHPAAATEATEAEVLLDGQLGDDAAALGHVRDPETGHQLGRGAGQLAAVVRRAAATGRGPAR